MTLSVSRETLRLAYKVITKKALRLESLFVLYRSDNCAFTYE